MGYFEESISILKELKGDNDKDVAMGLLNLGESLIKFQDGTKAMKVYEEAKSIYNYLLNDKTIDKDTLFEYTRNKGCTFILTQHRWYPLFFDKNTLVGLVSDALGSLKL